MGTTRTKFAHRGSRSALLRGLCLVGALFFLTAHEVPAPIEEQSPTPTPQESAKRKLKRTVTPAAHKGETPIAEPNLDSLDGTWVGGEIVTQQRATWDNQGLKPPFTTNATITISEKGKAVSIIGGICPRRFDEIWWKDNVLSFRSGDCILHVSLSGDRKTLIETGTIYRPQISGPGPGYSPAYHYEVSGTFHRQ